MSSIPPAAEPLIHEFASAFTRPTFQRFVILLFAAILTLGRRTVTNLLRTVHALAPGHPSSYHRVFSKRRWLWSDWVFAAPEHHGAFAKLSRPIRAVLLYALAPAA